MRPPHTKMKALPVFMIARAAFRRANK